MNYKYNGILLYGVWNIYPGDGHMYFRFSGLDL